MFVCGGYVSSCNSYTISAESGYDQYIWSNGQTTQEITVTESNTYTVTAFQTCDFGDIEGFTFLNSFLNLLIETWRSKYIPIFLQ